ncbi:ABC transporter substrate-binding protein [Noviherbaspirillum saxi]|uniref:ABC transporter permease n=1 Tax=Noviherbaspirillum saxi TaxID=2320863 RepID=A0A3A3FQI5_9BURK|nr:ABC transporter substrate-binding protein [Noviherbaspirillum saxi]RJF95722.1 ABC transporter permease [Noviherbaspirillum saxi]
MRITGFLRNTALLVLGSAFHLGAFAQGVTADDVLFGTTRAMSGPMASITHEVFTGAGAYLDHVNAQGGVHGRKIRLIALDDGYDPARAVANVKRLIEKDKVFALFGVTGAPTNMAIMPLLAEAGIPSIAPLTASEALRKPFNRYVFHVMCGIADEIDKIAEHLAIRGINKVGVVYVNNAFGQEGMALTERAFAAHKIAIVTKNGLESNSADTEEVSAYIAKSAPQAVFLLTIGKQTIDFVKAYNRQAPGAQYFGTSSMGLHIIGKALGKDGAGMVTTQATPFPYSATNNIVMEYQKIMTQRGLKYSFESMGGFLYAKFLVEGLRRAGRDLSRERYMHSLETMGKVDFDGYSINYSKTDHSGTRYVELMVLSRDGEIRR